MEEKECPAAESRSGLLQFWSMDWGCSELPSVQIQPPTPLDEDDWRQAVAVGSSGCEWQLRRPGQRPRQSRAQNHVT